MRSYLGRPKCTLLEGYVHDSRAIQFDTDAERQRLYQMKRRRSQGVSFAMDQRNRRRRPTNPKSFRPYKPNQVNTLPTSNALRKTARVPCNVRGQL